MTTSARGETTSNGPPVVFRREGPIGWIVLNRPAKSNALDRAGLVELSRILAEAKADISLRVLVLTAEGSSFSAGADLAEVGGPDRSSYLDLWHATLAELRGVSKPMVGAIQGTAVAGGLELALCCDLLIAAESARLGDAHIQYGLVPGAGCATVLPRRIGLTRARQLLFTGCMESAATLQEWGLLNWVVPNAHLIERAREVAVCIASFSLQALLTMKALSAAAVNDALLEEEARAMRAHLDSPDAVEGLAAFRERRAPNFLLASTTGSANDQPG
jgi:enoyl-CoA hydratase/carnithine racemase